MHARSASFEMNFQLTKKTTKTKKVQYEIPKVVCTQSSLQLMTKAYVLTASKIARERLGLPREFITSKLILILFNREILCQETCWPGRVGRVEARKA